MLLHAKVTTETPVMCRCNEKGNTMVEPKASLMFTNISRLLSLLSHFSMLSLSYPSYQQLSWYSIILFTLCKTILNFLHSLCKCYGRHYYTNIIHELLIFEFISWCKNSSQISMLHYRWYRAWTVKAYTIF